MLNELLLTLSANLEDPMAQRRNSSIDYRYSQRTTMISFNTTSLKLQRRVSLRESTNFLIGVNMNSTKCLVITQPRARSKRNQNRKMLFSQMFLCLIPLIGEMQVPSLQLRIKEAVVLAGLSVLLEQWKVSTSSLKEVYILSQNNK